MSIVFEPRLSKFFLVEGKEEVVPFIIRIKGVAQSKTRSIYFVAIDSSWSMDGSKIFFAKEGVIEMLKMLDSNDYVSIYSFHGKVSKVVSLEKVSNIDRIIDAVASIKLGGGTNIYEVLEHIYRDSEEAKSTAIGDESMLISMKMVMVTDGNPTTGVKDEDKILALAEKLRKNLSLSLVVGVGDDYNERLLAGLAERVRGFFEHLKSPSKMVDLLKEMASRYRSLSAKDVRLFVKTPPGVGVYIYNRPAYNVRGGIEIEVGDVYENDTLDIVGEFIVPPQRRGMIYLATIEGEYISNGAKKELKYTNITMPCIHTVSPEDIEVDEKVFKEINMVRVASIITRDLYGTVSADKLSHIINEILNSTVSIDRKELYTRTIDLKTQLEREGLSEETTKKFIALITRILSGRYE